MVPSIKKENKEKGVMIELDETGELQAKLDKMLIGLVKERPALYDLRVPQKHRTKMMKEVLWQEISTCMNGQLKPNSAEMRWKYLRENYLKARKKLQTKQEIAKRAGFEYSGGKNGPYSYRYHKIMEFLDDSLDYQKMVTMNNVRQSRARLLPSKSPKKRTAKVKIKSPIQTEVSEENHTNIQIESVKSAADFEVNADEQSNSESTFYYQETSDFENISNIKSTEEISNFDQIFLECLNKPIEKPSPIDGFLIRLGEGLRRLPYRERSKIELEFLTRLNEVEEELELKNSDHDY